MVDISDDDEFELNEPTKGAPKKQSTPNGKKVASLLDDEELTRWQYFKSFWTKGNVANLISFIIAVVGIVLVAIWPNILLLQYILSFGVFAFSGGITNYIAIKMLFEKIPGLYGSGIIELKFEEIKASLKDIVLQTFFNVDFLERYLNDFAGDLINSFDLETKLKELLESDSMDELVDIKLKELSNRPEGMWLSMMGVDTQLQLKPMIRPLIMDMSVDIVPILSKNFMDSKSIPVETIRTEIEKLITTKLQEIEARHVKNLLVKVMRDHLGWIIIWGNIFGGIIGLLTKAINIELQVFEISDFRF